MAKARNRDLEGAAAAADGLLGLEHQDLPAGPGKLDGRGEPVRPGSHDHRVVPRRAAHPVTDSFPHAFAGEADDHDGGVSLMGSEYAFSMAVLEDGTMQAEWLTEAF